MCKICRKKFTHKGTYERHINRKYSCLAVDDYQKNGIVDTPFQICQKKHVNSNMPTPVFRQKTKDDSPLFNGNAMVINEQNFLKNKNLPYSSSSVDTNYHNTKNENKNGAFQNSNTMFCIYCNACYKYQSSYKRHIKNCIAKPITKEDISNLESKIVNAVETILPSKIPNHIENNIKTKTINNNTINQNIIYVDNRNFNNKLRQFGKEDIEYLTNDLMKNIISQPEQGIIKLIQQVHFNEEQPQNQNIQMTNKKNTYLEVFNGEKWEKQDKKIAIQNMITTKKDIMDDYFDEQAEKNILSTFIKKNYETFSNMLDNYVRESLTDYDDSIKTRVVRKCLRFYRQLVKQAELLLIQQKKSSKIEGTIIPTIETDSEDDT